MKQFKSILIFSVILLCSCENSLNGPVGSELNYEPILLSVGQEVEFGTIYKDTIRVKLSDRNKGCYVLEYPNNQTMNCPLYASKIMLSFIMCNDKYKVTFNYKTIENQVLLQLYKYEIL